MLGRPTGRKGGPAAATVALPGSDVVGRCWRAGMGLGGGGIDQLGDHGGSDLGAGMGHAFHAPPTRVLTVVTLLQLPATRTNIAFACFQAPATRT